MTRAVASPLVDLEGVRAGTSRGERGPWRAGRRRRRVPYLALGGLLVVVCVLGFAAATVRLGQRVSVLAIAQPVAAGQRIEAADLTQVSAADDPSLGLIPVSQAASVEGRTAVVTLLLGASDAGRLAGAGGVVLMQTAPGGD